MKITKERFLELNPCADGRDWYLENCKQGDLLTDLLKLNTYRPDWSRWLFTRLMTVKQRRMIAYSLSSNVHMLLINTIPTVTA